MTQRWTLRVRIVQGPGKGEESKSGVAGSPQLLGSRGVDVVAEFGTNKTYNDFNVDAHVLNETFTTDVTERGWRRSHDTLKI